jgi:hypothetical protein
MARPAPSPQISTFAKTPAQILQTVSQRFLQNTAEISEDILHENTANQPFQKGVTIAGHNTLTRSTTKIFGMPIVSVNQELSLDDYMSHCAVTGKCFLDIDMHNDNGQIVSYHGGPIGGLERIINTSPNVQKTSTVLEKVHSFASSHPNVTFTIRIENHDMGARELEGMLTPAMKSQVATFSKHNMPTHGELQSKGTNVVYFLENVNSSEVNPETGIITDSVVMAQDNYFVRTNWNDIKGLTSTDDIKSHLIYDVAKLPKNPMILVDGYNTAIAANVTALPTQSSFVATVTTTTLPRIKEAMASEGLDVQENGCVIMMDYVNADAFSYQVALDFVETIPNTTTRETVQKYMPSIFVELQAEVYQNVQQGIGDTFYKLSGTEIAVGSISLLCFLFAMAALKRKFLQSGKEEEAEDITDYIDDKLTNHPELQPIFRKAEEESNILDNVSIDAIPFVNDPSSRLSNTSSPRSNMTGSEPQSPTSTLNNGNSVKSNTSKMSRKEKKRRRRNRQDEEAFLKWGTRRKGGYRKRLQ